MANCSAKDGLGLRAYLACRLRIMWTISMPDTGQDDRRGGRRFEAKHRPDPTLDAPMILLDPVIEVAALPDPDRLQLVPRPLLQAICSIARSDRLAVGLAAVEYDAIRSAMTVQRLSKEAFGRGQVPMLDEIEFDRAADAVYGAIKIHPPAADLDVGLVDMPFSGNATFASVEALQQ